MPLTAPIKIRMTAAVDYRSQFALSTMLAGATAAAAAQRQQKAAPLGDSTLVAISLRRLEWGASSTDPLSYVHQTHCSVFKIHTVTAFGKCRST